MRNFIGYLLYDLDGCLYDTQPHIENAFYQHTGVRFPMSEWRHSDDLAGKFMELTGCSYSVTEKVLFGDEIITKAQPLAGSQEFVTEALEEGYIPCVASARPHRQYGLTIEMLARDFPEIDPFDVYLLLSNTPASIHKRMVCVQTEAVAMVEDNSGNVRYVHRKLPPTHRRNFKVGMIDKPWNRDLRPRKSNVIKVLGNWENNDPGWSDMRTHLAFSNS